MQSPYQVLLFLFFHFSLPASSLLFPEARLVCSPAYSSHDPTFISDFVTVMDSLAHRITTVGWAAHSSGSVYGLGQCLSDLSQSDCALCFAQARTKLPSCLPSNAGRIFLDGCFLRYDNYSFFAEPIDPQHDNASCGSNSINGKVERSLFALNVNYLLKNVTDTAVGNHGFAAGLRGDVHGLAQCWKSVEKEGCRECLEKAGREVMGCLPSDEGRGLNAGCYLRYSTKNVYSQAQNMVEGQQRKDQEASPKSVFLLAIAASVSSAVLLSVLGVCIGYGKFSERKQARTNLGKLSSAVMKSNLNFKYEMLEKATEFFDPSRKLGQGGAGSVYRGILPGGRTVAVKRLSFSTRQWVDEFFNEVNLISGVQHKNLVQLLGCSIEGPESLLVYEYVRNKSLDQFLFNKSKTGILSWEKRFEIIVGIAEGLAYLHEGSGMRIIHRDIKSSNVLLDENLNPKIADFGLARCVSADRSHLSTGIAGTLGYMAPEYLVRGQLTEKADVYSFGVLVLEIVCGRKNSVYAEESSSILQMVWNRYKSNTLPDAVDECLRRQFPAEAASKVFQIGLLCTQASVPLRPSMSGVVQMLTEDNCPIPSPKQPPFLNASMGDPNASSVSMSFPSSASPATSYGLTTPTSVQK